MTSRSTFGIVRLVVALVTAVALVFRFIWGLGSATFTPGNFFAYLTIQSNIVFVVITVLAGLLALRLDTDPQWLTTARAAVLTCTVTAGLVYALIVQQSGERGFPISVPWSDILLHFVLPIVALADWVLAPGRGRAQWRAIAWAVTFTLGWGGVTLVRGAVVGWYPYFFLDPDQLNSVGEFFLFSGIAVGVFVAVGALVVGLSRLRPVLGRN